MSVDFSTLSLTDLLAKRTEIDTQLALKTGGAVVNATGKKGKKSKAEKKQSKRAGKPTVYGAFSSKIQKEHVDEIKAFKEANPEMKGAHMSFVGTYKKEHDEEYKAFEAEWREAHPKDAVESSPDDAEVGDSASSSGQPVAAEKPKRVLSPEHLAKLKAGREAAKAKKDAEKATSEEAGKSESDVAPATAPEEPKKKQPKKAKKADAPTPAPQPTPAPEPVAAEENDDAPEFLPFKFGGLQYLRLGTKREDGNHLWATGDLWSSKKGAKGPYVGCMTESGEIDTDAEEPTLE
jgi:hypothetical protein